MSPWHVKGPPFIWANIWCGCKVCGPFVPLLLSYICLWYLASCLWSIYNLYIFFLSLDVLHVFVVILHPFYGNFASFSCFCLSHSCVLVVSCVSVVFFFFFISLWSFVCSVISSFFIPYLRSCFASRVVCICLMLYIFFVVIWSFCPLLFCDFVLCCVSLRSFLSLWGCLVSVVICVSCSSFVSLYSCIT